MLTRLTLLALALAGLTLWAGCTFQPGDKDRAPVGGFGVPEPSYGPDTLEERILRSSAIVRARLLSATPATERRTDPAPTHHVAVVELRFKVLEYLRGGGAGELVALVTHSGIFYDSSGKALEGARAIRDNRDTQWDNREAILFLIDDVPHLADSYPSIKKADRYWLGSASDGYTVASGDSKRWLPAVVGATSGSAGQRFLLDASTSPPTITLADMKARIAAIDQEIAKGVAGVGDAARGGSALFSQDAGALSAAYRECLYEKYEWARQVRYRKGQIGSFPGGRDYYYIRHDSAIGSGLPAGTRAFTDPNGGEGETPPPTLGDIPIIGRDAELFSTAWPGVADTVRPLPAGEYRFHFSYRFQGHVICDAEPEEEKKRQEVFVTVTAPAGTVHEAFFDPLSGASGVPVPSEFSVGGVSTSAQRLQWLNGAVSLLLSPYADLSGHALDIIALDGTVSLSLDAGSATVDQGAGTLTWSVPSQPWADGDRLMLRIRKGSASTVTQASKPEVSVTGGGGVTEGASASFTLTASPAPSSALAVNVTVSQSGDFGVTTGSQTVTIPTGGTTTLAVSTTGDSVDESDGSVTVTLNKGSDYTVSSSQGTATVTVADDDPTTTVSITGGSGVTEGGDASFTVTASPAPASDLTVNVTVSQGGNYGVSTGSRTVTVGTSGTSTLTVSTTDDSADEADGSVTVTLNKGSGYTVSSSQGSATVAVSDDDDPKPEVKISVTVEDASATEGEALTFRVRLSAASTEEIRVRWYAGVAYHVLDDRAGSTDYQAAEGELVFAPGVTELTAEVWLEQDDEDEPDEYFAVDAYLPGSFLPDAVGTMTIVDDD